MRTKIKCVLTCTYVMLVLAAERLQLQGVFSIFEKKYSEM